MIDWGNFPRGVFVPSATHVWAVPIIYERPPVDFPLILYVRDVSGFAEIFLHRHHINYERSYRLASRKDFQGIPELGDPWGIVRAVVTTIRSCDYTLRYRVEAIIVTDDTVRLVCADGTPCEAFHDLLRSALLLAGHKAAN
jgi:hypothetical protein